MRWTSILTSFLPQRRTRDPEPLPLQTRVATLESEMLSLHQSAERTYGVVKKLQGKIYRGVALGDTTEAAPAASVDVVPEGNEVIPMSDAKAELYRRAAELRRH